MKSEINRYTIQVIRDLPRGTSTSQGPISAVYKEKM